MTQQRPEQPAAKPRAKTQADGALSDAALDKVTGGDDKKTSTTGQTSNMLKAFSDTQSGVVQNLK